MPTSMLGEIGRLQKMSVAELQREWEIVFGSPPTSTSRQHLWKRLCWELQARAHGGLSPETEDRLDSMGQEVFNDATSRHQRAQDAEPEPPTTPAPKVARIRDPRRLAPGTVLARGYRGTEIRVVALDDGQFEYDGQVFTSLSAVAHAVTGAKWNGRLFFGLTQRKRSR